MKLLPTLSALLLSGLLASPVLSQDTPETPSVPERNLFDPYFLGYETEPDMDYAGRTVMSLQSGLSRAIGRIGDVGERHPGVAPAWEFPLGAVLLLFQHEIGGHGGRAREFSLSPSYGFGYDLSAYTTTSRDPETNEQLALLAAGGAEADTVMAHRLLLDLAGPSGADGAKVPLLFMAKLDLPLYIFSTADPEPGEDDEDFGPQFEDGNDVAIYLVARQAQRKGIPAPDVWNRGYKIDFGDPLLEDNWDDARVTALWHLLDPSLVASVVSYFREHVLGGQTRVRAAGLRLSDSTRFLVGTRGALAPQSVSRFLDLYFTGEQGLLTAYVRDLDSSIDCTYGAGAGLHGLRLGRADLSLSADYWQEPDSEEGLYEGTGWNATAELATRFASRWGIAAKLGAKSEGFFPGLPLDEGVYVGFGVRASL